MAEGCFLFFFITGAHQNSSSPYLAKYPSLMEGPRLNWKTVLEDAGKLDGYKLMYANKKKREEMEVSIESACSQTVGIGLDLVR